MDKKALPYSQVLAKLEAYCAYQERCHAEVRTKLSQYVLESDEAEQILTTLIQNGFLNESRFVEAFVRGKARLKQWGPIKIKAALRAKNIPEKLIDSALQSHVAQFGAEIDPKVAQKAWNKAQKGAEWQRKAQFYAFLQRQGYTGTAIEAAWDHFQSNTHEDL